MPILNEKDAILVRDTFDLLSDEEKPLASDWMRKYEAQQNDLGEPLFPSQVQAMEQSRQALRKMFDGLDKVQAEISPWSENPNRDRAIHANMALLSARLGKKPQEIADRYEFHLNDYAARQFGITQGVDDLSFYAAASKEIQREKQKEDTSMEGVKAALRGEDSIAALQAWQMKNSDRIGDSSQFWGGFTNAQESISGVGVSDAVEAYQRAMQGAPKDGDEETLKDFEALLLDLPGVKRKAVITAAAMMAQAKGENSVKGVGARESGPMGGAGSAINAITGFFQEIGESGGRFVGKLGGIAKDEELDVMANLPALPLLTDAAKARHPLATGVAYTSTEKIDSAEKAADFIKEWKVTSFGTASADVTRADIEEAGQSEKQYRELDADEKKFIEAAQKRELKKNQIARELRSIAESSDPVGEISGAIGSSVAMAAANIITRGKTLPISWQLYSEANYDQLRLENPLLEPSEARAISRVSGAGEAAWDALEIGILRKLPSVAAVLKSGTSAAWRNAGARLGATFAFEQAQEGVQDLTLPFTRAVFEAVGRDTGLDMAAEWERWKDSRGTVAIASIPLILLGAGIATHRDIKDAQNWLSSRDRLGEQGIIEVDAVPIIEAAQAGKMEEAQALYRNAFKRRSSEVAAEYQAKLETQQKVVAEAVIEVTRQGLIPEYTLLPGGKVVVTDLNDGSKATFDSWREAQPVIEQSMNEMERINNDSILRIADDILQRGEEVTVSPRPSESLATRVRGGSMSPEDAIKAAIAGNVINGVSIDEARQIAADVFGGSQEERIKIMREAVERAIVLGSNVVQNGVSKSKLFKSSNLTTLIEETSEGRLKEGLRVGRYKKSDWLGLIRQAEEATGEKFLLGSTADAVNASPDFAPRELIEAVSRIVVADVLGRLQDGRRIGSGSITKSLEENNSPLVAWIRAFKRYLASVLRTAKRIREARKTGKLGDEYDAYIDDLLGVDQQAALENEAAIEAEAIANEALYAGGASYSEENPGPNGETFSIGRVKNGGRLLTFERPIETPLGRVVSYEWQSDLVEDVDKDGEAVLKRVSDWDKAVSNAETGRAIVHHFTVIQPDGSEKIVSLESALKATKGTETGKALSAAVKAARRLPLREAELTELEKTQGDYDAAIKDANAQGWRNAPEPELRTPEFLPLAERGVKAVYVGDQFIKNLEPNELGAFGYKPAETEWKKQWAVGQLQRPSYGTLDRIQTLRRLIKKDKALIDSAALFSSRAVPADSSRVVQMPDGARLVGPTTFSIAEYAGNHRPNDEGPRAFDLLEGGIAPADVYQHPEWYSAMEPKVIRETMAQLRKVKGNPKSKLTIYRAGPKGEMNGGDWVSLSKEYARTHAESQDPEGFKVWQAQVSADSVRWSLDDLAEFGYFGDTVAANDSGETFSVRAFHGTPHKVDKFTTAKIGTGEGAQAYGWGLYFAESQGVARNYQNRLVANNPDSFAIITLDGVELPRKWADLVEMIPDSDQRDAIRGIQESGLSYTPTFGSDAKNKKVTAALAELRGRVAIKQPAGNLYTVELIPDEADFLDWDKPLAEQSEKVKAALTQAYINRGMPLDESNYPKAFKPNPSGEKIYAFIGGIRGEEFGSKALLAAGIPGIKYLDGGSRINKFTVKANDGTGDVHTFTSRADAEEMIRDFGMTKATIEEAGVSRNFVLFDESLVKILEENGKPVSGETFSLRSVSPAQDADYMAAVESGDVAKQQAMVDEAAKAAGYDRMLFHQTHKDNVPKINKEGFRLDKPGARASDNEMPDGIFLKPDSSDIKVGAASAQDIEQMRLFTRLENPLIFQNRQELVDFITSRNPDFRSIQAEFSRSDRETVAEVDRLESVPLSMPAGKDQDSAWERYFAESDLVFERGRIALNEIAARARAMATEAIRANADGIIVYNDVGSFKRSTTTVVVLDPNQIKSADPITRDEQGNVIPLSQRFNPADNRITFSIRSGDFASRMSAAFSPFQRNPELRMAIAQVAKQRAQRLGAEWIEKSAVLRTVGSIAKEQGIREALGYDERINAYLESLTPSARQELEFEPASLEDDPLIAAMLDHGKLMSRSTALKNGVKNLDEFDGVPWLPPAWYSKGAGITPGAMAKAMHEGPRGEGGPLSAGDSAQDLWEALGQIIASTKKNKAAHREAVQAYKEAQRAARADAKLEAEAWANQTRKAAGSPKAQRDMLKGALRLLDGILAAAPPEVRARVGGYVKLAGLATDEAMLQEIERRIEKLNVELEKWLKKEGVAEIQKLLKRGRPEAEAGKRGKGKDPDMHALFAAAERAIPMTADAVAGELARLDTLIGGDTLTPEQEALAITERGIVELVGDLKSADSGRVFSALDSLREIYEGGWLKWKLRQIEKREERAGMRADFIADTGKSGIKPERDAADKAAVTLLGKIKGGFLSLSSFQEVLSYAFGSKSDRVKALVDAEREASGQYEDVTQALADEVEALFADLAGGSVLAGERLRYDMAQRTIQTGKGELSQLEAIQALLMWRQEDGRRHMEGAMDENGKPIGPWNYDQAWIDEITAALTPEARSVMSWLSQKYASEHPALNALYRERYGVNMPAHDNYAPITVQPVQTKSGEVNDPVSGAAISSGSILVPGSLRARSRSAIAEPDFRDALQTFMAHTRQLEYWKAYYDLAFEASAILGNREVLNAVKAKGGEPAATALRKWIDAIAQGGFRDASSSLGLHKMLSRMTGRAASVGLLGRFSTLLVQSTQLGAASVKMPVGAYLIRLSKLLTGNLSFRDAVNSPFIQRRYKSAPPIVRQALEGLGVASRPNQITRATRHLGNLLSGADAMFTAGTYAMLLDYHRGTGRALGLTGAELETHAHTEAERDTEAVAQPTRMATRSLAELTSTNPLAKVSWAYASEARQKIALMAWATMNAKAEPAQFAKTAFLVFGIGGLMTQILKNLWREAKGDDDESKWAPERLTLSALAGPLHGVPLASELMGDQGMLSGVAWAWPALKDIASGEGDMRDVDTLLSTLGLFNDTAAGIASLSHAGLDAAKVLENLASEK